MQRRRLLFYLLLNALVSACVVGIALFVYDRYYRPDCRTAVYPTSPSSPASTVTDESQLDIISVIGAGTVSSEIVVIKNGGTEPVVLDGWSLRDGGNNIYTFPQLTLNPDGTVQVHTASGENTPVDLYWNLAEPVWESGDIASLFDPQGNLRALYTIP
jgi:hypothetical protein